MMELILGDGTTLITSTHRNDGKYAGISFSKVNPPMKIGDHLNPYKLSNQAFFRIITDNPDSLDILINALEKAKRYFVTNQPNISASEDEVNSE